MEPIDISSTDSEPSDRDNKQYKALDDSSVRDSATSVSNSGILPAFASSSGTSNAGRLGSSQQSPPPMRKSVINGHPSHSNYNSDDEVQILSSSSSGFANSKRVLPSSLQPLGPPTSGPLPKMSVSEIYEAYVKPYARALLKAQKALWERVNSNMMKVNHQETRVSPQSLRLHVPVSTSQHVGPHDLRWPSGVVDEQAVGDERLIHQVALQDLNQPLTEANLPDGLLSVSLLRHQKIALAWMAQKENSVACSGGILADDQVNSL